jgi:hypothetical protein
MLTVPVMMAQAQSGESRRTMRQSTAPPAQPETSSVVRYRQAHPTKRAGASVAAQDPEPTLIGSGTYLIQAKEGNLLVHVGPRDTLIVGAMTPQGTSVARRWLAKHHAPPVHFALASDGPNLARYADGGWGSHGAVTIAHERLRSRMVSDAKAPGRPAGVALPTLGFSEVQQMYISDDQVHAVHQAPGYGDADLSVHFEAGNILYFGQLVTTDGYPDLDLSTGGNIDGLIKTVADFSAGFGDVPTMRFVPARGPVANGALLAEYVAMLQGVRERVSTLVAQGLDDEAIARAQPLQDFDARWGRGRLTSAAFAGLVAASLRPH